METDVWAIAAYIANYLRKSFPMVDRDDIYQEISLWVVSHPAKVEEWTGPEVGQHELNKLHKSMRRAGLRLCQVEKARVLGYRPEDNYYYEVGLIRDALTRIWDQEAWTNPPQPNEQAKVKYRSVAEGNNYITTLADVSRVTGMLTVQDQEILKAYYNDGFSATEIAASLDTTAAAVNSRINRLVKRIQRMLGGERPEGND